MRNNSRKKKRTKKDKDNKKEAKTPTNTRKEKSKKNKTTKRTREGASILKTGKYGSKANAKEEEVKQPSHDHKHKMILFDLAI